MPASPARLAEAERIAARVRSLVAQGLDRPQIIERLGISKATANRLMKAARNPQENRQCPA